MPRGTQDTRLLSITFVYRTFTFFGPTFQLCSASYIKNSAGPTTPYRSMVWANPVSLAATWGIDFSLFSSRYLDVSVPWVAFHTLCIHAWITDFVSWVAPFGYLRVNACLQLFVAFRSLPRPSSALGAKAFTVCPY